MKRNSTDKPKSLRWLGWMVAVGSFAVAFASPLGGVDDAKPGRRSTDPPVAARGKLGQDLFLAIDHRDVAGVQELIKRGADANARNGLEFTPLYVAAASYQMDVMQALLGAGAKVDAESAYGTTLMFASISGNLVGAKMLLDRGANVNVTRVDGMTPLMMAANAGNPALVAELIKRKADVKATSNSSASALSFAARAGNVDAGRALLAAGATVDNRDSDKLTPLMEAAKAGHAEFVQLLLDYKAKPNARNAKGFTPLYFAAAYGDDPAVVRALLAAGANPKSVDSKGQSAGEVASARGFKESAAVLGVTANGAAPNANPDKAIRASLKLLQYSMSEFNRKAACISCHQEGLGRMTTASARARGFALDPELNKAQSERIRGALGFLKPLHSRALVDGETMKQLPLIEINEVSTGYSWLLAGMAAQGDQPNEATASAAMVLARQQSDKGNWTFSLPRIPMQSSSFTLTALSLKSIGAYGPKAQSAELGERVEKAKAWLLGAESRSSDDRAFRLLGLKWAGAPLEDRKKAIDDILAAQNADGGWSQQSGMRSDAYATGQSLYALRVAGGMEPNDPVYRLGTSYLLRTQDADGSWFVNKRAIPANNYFDAGFPHRESQYASFNATCWATMALLETIPTKQSASRSSKG